MNAAPMSPNSAAAATTPKAMRAGQRDGSGAGSSRSSTCGRVGTAIGTGTGPPPPSTGAGPAGGKNPAFPESNSQGVGSGEAAAGSGGGAESNHPAARGAAGAGSAGAPSAGAGSAGAESNHPSPASGLFWVASEATPTRWGSSDVGSATAPKKASSGGPSSRVCSSSLRLNRSNSVLSGSPSTEPSSSCRLKASGSKVAGSNASRGTTGSGTGGTAPITVCSSSLPDARATKGRAAGRVSARPTRSSRSVGLARTGLVVGWWSSGSRAAARSKLPSPSPRIVAARTVCSSSGTRLGGSLCTSRSAALKNSARSARSSSGSQVRQSVDQRSNRPTRFSRIHL